MTSPHTLRCYDYVNQPFERVRAALREDAAAILATATSRARAREHALAVQLRVRLGALEVATDVKVDVGSAVDTKSSPLGYEITVFPVSWQAIERPSLFPHMKAKLSVYPLSSRETQLEFEGTYDPPFGWLGDAVDAIVGNRIAEASVLAFIQDVAVRLRQQLAETTTA